MAEPRSYLFPALERRGVVAGLRAGQLLVVGAALFVGIVAVRVWPDADGAALAGVMTVGASAVAFLPVRGQSVEQWAPLAARRAVRVATRRHRVEPFGQRRFGPADGLCTPDALVPGLRFTSVARPGAPPVAVIHDRASGSETAVLAVRGRSFALLDAADKDRRLGGWGNALAALSREGGPVRRVQWLERTVPGDAEALTRHVSDAARLPARHPALASYLGLVAEAGPLGQDHECFVALTVRGGRRDRATGVLLRELRLFEGQLRSAEIEVDHVLEPRELGAVIQTAIDPWSRVELARQVGAHPDLPGPPPDRAWPATIEESWASLRTDATWHATFWVAEWPRTEVGADFLAPMLLHQIAQRSLSVVMAPLPPSAGAREAEAARTAQAADEQLRQRSGFLTTARRRREAEGVARRESELSDGHAPYRFSGYVTVTAHDAEALDEACGDMVQAAHQCRVELRRLYGIQDRAFTWTLPFGRGLAGR